MAAKIFERAKRVLGTPEHARLWMNSPLIALENHSPLDLLRDINGYERVRTVLGRVASGSF
jgi:putative toxin-antitoxin system antitoxin component (TIGR02293 family)